MTDQTTHGVLITALSLTVLAAPLGAQAVETHACASVADDKSRLACYDAAFGRSDKSSGGAVVTPRLPSLDAAVPPAQKAVNDFGLTETDRRARDQSTEVVPQNISGSVAVIGHRPAGEAVVTLDNGQVWTQIEAGTRLKLTTGDAVTIRKASLGSYMLVTPSGIAVRVRRVK